MRPTLLCLALLLTGVLTGCESSPDDPSATTAEQDRQLNDAADQLDLNTPAPAESPAP